MKKYILVVFWLFIFCVILSSCNKQVSNTPKDNAKPDYSDPASWITSFETTKEVDVFYVYPTVSSNGSGNMDITNKNEQALAKGIFDAQASVFKGNANVYAPYYRQMSTGAKIPDDPNALATDLDEFKKAAGDVQDAFNYYINNLNNGRPFIIAGHSQGTMALIELIKKEFGNSEDLRKRLVAAYLIGYTVTDEDLALSGLTAAQGESDTGVVVTFNTQSATSVGGPMLMKGANCINPLNWKTDATPADASLNKGAVFFNDSTGEFLREAPQYCGAEINPETGALMTTKIEDELEIGPYPEGVYHRFDYALWYRNIEQNVKVRIESYLKNNLDTAAKLPAEPDYTEDFAWVSKPGDVSKPVDVFYVYPTIYTGMNPVNMDISDSDMREFANGLLTAQAGVYSPHTNLFAPFYRQQSAATQSMEANNGGNDAFADPIFRVGYEDVQHAFDYYIEYLNEGRPFIIAGHSQGSMIVIELLRNRLDNPDLQKQFIAAYPIGYSVTKTDLENYPWMKLANGETDTGVIITFNTQGPNAVDSPVLLTGAVAINPLNWKTDATPAGRETNIGANFFNDSTGEVLEKIPNFAGAYIDTNTGALIATDIQDVQSDEVNLEDLGRWSDEVYHMFDYSFFYENLKENVGKRIDAYLSRKK